MYKHNIIPGKIKALVSLFVVLLLTYAVAAQQPVITVRGVVYEKGTNMPIPGVIIFTGKPPKGVGASGADGTFTVNVPEGAELNFQAMGFGPLMGKGKAGELMKVYLSVKQNKLNEQVVIGYQKKTKETTTGSTVIISGKDLQDVPVSNVIELLQGKVAGMNIQNNTGAPGYAGTIQMRGLSTLSISGSGSSSFLSPTSPLFVIDGVPIDPNTNYEYGFNQAGPGLNPLSLIPPEDIESIQVLKDAQATALYGSRGAYGVMLVNTKRGKSKVPIVQYSGNFFISIPPNLRKVIGGNAEREARVSQLLHYTDSVKYARQDINSTPFLADSLNPYYNNSTNWQGLFYKYTYNQTHNVTVSGGDDRFNYKANLGYYNEKGIVKNTDFNRYTLSTNMQYRPITRFKIYAGITTSLGQNSKGSGNGLTQSDVGKAGKQSSLLPAPSFYSSSANAVAALRNDNLNKTANIRTNVDLDYELIAGLHATSTFSFESTTGTEDNFIPAAINGNYAQVKSFNDQSHTLYSRSGLSYFKSFEDKHNLTFSVFNELSKKDYQATLLRKSGTPSDDVHGPIGSNGFFDGGGILDNGSDERLASFAGAASYNYKQKYVVDLSFRRDASSITGKKTPYSNNPSVGLRWNFYKEALLADRSWLDYGSLRASWGRNVIPQGTIFDAYGTYNDRNGGRYNDKPMSGIDYGKLPNANMKPVSNTQWNGGLELGLWKGKLQVEMDVYLKKVENMLMEVKLPTSSGFSSVQTNDAALMDAGLEWSFTYRPLPQTGKWNWTVTFNGAFNKDILTRLPNGKRELMVYDTTNNQNILYRVGRNSLTNVLMNTRGVYADDASVQVDPATGRPVLVSSADGKNFYYMRAGDPLWTDRNGDYIINGADNVYAGNSQPLITGGLSSFLQHGAWSLNIAATYTAIRSILNNAVQARFAGYSDPLGKNGPGALVPLDQYNYWAAQGDKATYPNPYDYQGFKSIRPYRVDQTLFEEDGSYFKIQYITLAYTIPRTRTIRWGITSCRTYFTVSNPFLFSRYSGPNPENVSALGRDQEDGYPVRKTVTLGLNVQF
ncbi:TonB-linked SusC/RagA family outer membrane protein [Chitinophaga niastensis]|uniref:TonB-linked SusC/RagA family outer membrane protein n=1 Tax=Chitinophaga niastensis TaxID=536980 RepID=A0A2P8HJ61_CHINA|nr:SusC/RagA family TonB-linked outer membrane protein [Chitinophaga niastensis]PSL46252.1 TonB-linked SusC/RagA family outer membrane protein [Chitinophaga niastensis]